MGTPIQKEETRRLDSSVDSSVYTSIDTIGSSSQPDTPPTPADFLEIWLPGSPIPVRIEYAAIRELRANFGGGGERTGLLLGSFSRQALLIQHCELLSVPEETPEAVGRCVQARLKDSREGTPRVVGFFRTAMSGWLGITESDREFAKRYLPVAGAVFMLIQTTGHRPWSVALSALDGDEESVSRAPAMEFPFDEYLLRNGYMADMTPSVEPPLPPVSARRHNFNGIVLIWAIAVLAVAVTVAVLAYRWPRASDRADLGDVDSLATGTLGFKVNRMGSDFEISWDRASFAVTRALGGTFTVRDGGITRTLQLSPAQLREGRIVYTPLLGDLDFRLEVATSDHRTQAESVQILAWSGTSATPEIPAPGPAGNAIPPRIPAQTAAPSPVRPFPGNIEAGKTPPAVPNAWAGANAGVNAGTNAGAPVYLPAPANRVPSALPPAAGPDKLGTFPALSGTVPLNAPPKTPGMKDSAPPSENAGLKQGAPPPNRAPVRQFTLPAAANQGKTESVLLQAPAAIPGGVVPSSTPLGVPAGVKDLGVPAVSAAPPPQPKPAPVTKEAKVGGELRPAALLKRVSPVYPESLKLSHIQGTVRFSATIGKDGKLRDIRLVSGNPALVQSALTAVKQWVYRPTMLNGEPADVPTQIDVDFALSGQ